MASDNEYKSIENKSDESEKLPGGYEKEFVDPIRDEDRCSLCKLVMKRAIQLSICGHYFCRDCIKPIMQDGRNKCPKCGSSLRRASMVFNTNHDRAIQELLVYCDNRHVGCKKTSFLHNCQVHARKCPYERQTCEYCKKTDISREDLNNHHGMCKDFPVLCSYEQFGCDSKLRRKEISEHEECFVQRHVTLMMTSFLQWQSETSASLVQQKDELVSKCEENRKLIEELIKKHEDCFKQSQSETKETLEQQKHYVKKIKDDLLVKTTENRQLMETNKKIHEKTLRMSQSKTAATLKLLKDDIKRDKIDLLIKSEENRQLKDELKEKEDCITRIYSKTTSALKQMKDDIKKIKNDLLRRCDENRQVKEELKKNEEFFTRSHSKATSVLKQLKDDFKKNKDKILTKCEEHRQFIEELMKSQESYAVFESKTTSALKQLKDDLKKSKLELKVTKNELKDELKKTKEELNVTKDELKDELRLTKDELRVNKDELKETEDDILSICSENHKLTEELKKKHVDSIEQLQQTIATLTEIGEKNRREFERNITELREDTCHIVPFRWEVRMKEEMWVEESPPFYTKKKGYKLYVKAWWYDGVYWFRCMLSKGANDNDLPWPMEGNISLIVREVATGKLLSSSREIYPPGRQRPETGDRWLFSTNFAPTSSQQVVEVSVQ